VAPVVLNGTVKAVRVLDSGASNLQIPQEVADELRRNGSLTDGDGLGSAAISCRRQGCAAAGVQAKNSADRRQGHGKYRRHRQRANSRVLLGQSVLRRLNGWAIDNVRNTLTLD